MRTPFDSTRGKLLGGVAALAFSLAAASPAFAQAATEDKEQQGTPAEDDSDETIVVTGFRAALENAVENKRESDQIVESISAEDIGKLPDNSIAEAIARLPGLTAQRFDGRAQVISIRGLAPDFATTLLNGREQVTTGDNRGIEFDQYPSELIGGVDVYKTPFAGLVGQGLSGTVNLKTIRPLAFGRQAIGVSVRGEKVSLGELNSGSTDTGYRVSGTYINQFANDTIGVMLGAAHMTSPNQVERFEAWGYPNAGPGGALLIGGAKPWVQSSELKRTGLIGSLEYEPTSSFTTRIDAFYSKFEEDHIIRGVEFPLAWSSAALAPGATVEDGVVTAGTFTGVKAVIRNDHNTRDADLFSIGWNAEYNAGPLTLVGDVSYSDVKRTDMFLETYAGTSRGGGTGPFDTVNFQLSPAGYYTFTTALDYSNPNQMVLTSPQGWGGDRVPGGQVGYMNMPSTNDELMAFRASAEYELGGGIESVEVGANYTTRRKDYSPDEWYLDLAANAADPLHNTSVPVPSSVLLDPTMIDYAGYGGVISYDPVRLLEDGTIIQVRSDHQDVALKSWAVDEDVLSGWVRANIDQSVGGGILTGNVGVQLVHTDQSSDGLATRVVNNVVISEPITDGDEYTEILPSMNLAFRFDRSDVLRLGIARTLARPRMEQMKASINYGFNPSRYLSTDPSTSFFSGGGGNARLRPWIADSIDVSYEHYFGREAYLAAAGFYKYLESYIYNQNLLYDFTGFSYEVPPGMPPQPGTFLGIVNLPANGSGGTIYGAELSGALPFSLFTPALDGFGVLGSYSYTETSIRPNPGDPSQPLPGFSKHVANATAYFEKYGFSARASVRHRSRFLAEVVGFGVSRVNRQAKAETVIDAQVGYEFQPGSMLQGLSILLQAQNLTDEPFVTYEANDPRRVIHHQSFGRRYLLGISYRM